MAATWQTAGETASVAQLKANVSIINRLDDAIFENLIDQIFDFLLFGKQTDAFVAKLTELSADTGLGLVAWKNVIRSFLSCLRDAGRHGKNASNLEADLTQLGIQPQKAAMIGQRWAANYITICRSMVGQTFMINQLVDMEWKFGVTAASSEMKRVGNSFLQLKLVTSKDNESTEDICLEMSLSQFYSFLHEMEKVKSNLDLLS